MGPQRTQNQESKEVRAAVIRWWWWGRRIMKWKNTGKDGFMAERKGRNAQTGEKRRKTAVQQQLSGANKAAWHPEEIRFPHLCLPCFFCSSINLLDLRIYRMYNRARHPPLPPPYPCIPFRASPQNSRLIYWSLFLTRQNYACAIFMSIKIRIHLLQQMSRNIKQPDSDVCL